MNIRGPHGTGAEVDPTVARLERTSSDEQPQVPTDVADPLASGRDAGGRVRTPEAARALARLPRRLAVLPKVIDCHPGFERHYRARLTWYARRRGELVAIGRGHISNGVEARLGRSAWLWAGAEFTAELAAQTANVALFSTSASLSAQADRLDWSAYQMAVREAKGREGRTDRVAELRAAAKGGTK